MLELVKELSHNAHMDEAQQSEEIIGRLLELNHRMRLHFEDTAESLGLSPAEARSLHVLGDPRPMSDLAGAMHCDASYVTQLADRLEEAGLVEREPDPDDRRVKRLVLTPKGEQTRRELVSRIHETTPALAGLNDQERARFLALLESLDRVTAS